MLPLIDPDLPDTWPAPVRDFVANLDKQTKKTRWVSDLHTPEDAESTLRGILSDFHVLAHHATRLLVHEVDDIQRDGLRIFSRELFDDRIGAGVS